MSRRRRTPSAEEKALWRLAMRDVVPRRPPVEEPAPPPPPSVPEVEPRRVVTAKSKSASMGRPPAPAATAPRTLRAGDLTRMDGRTAERLRRGKATVQDRIDLHGLREHEAQEALTGFILGARARGLQTVLVITGKGGTAGGVIRGRLARWLDEPPLAQAVLGYTQARPRDGGSGAFYVRLRRVRDEP